MPTGYRLELAKSGRAACNGQKPCKGTKIDKNELRFGTWVEIMGNGSFKWRHWGCVTESVIDHLKSSFNKVDDVDGYEDLPAKLQRKVAKAWDDGHVDPEDIPESAKSKGEEGDEEEGEEVKPNGSTPKKKILKSSPTSKSRSKDTKDKAKKSNVNAKKEVSKSKGRSKKVKEEYSEDEDEEDDDESNDESEAEESWDESEDEKPKKKRGRVSEDTKPRPKRAANKGKSLKEDSDNDSSEEEFRPKPKAKKARKSKSDPDEESD